MYRESERERERERESDSFGGLIGNGGFKALYMCEPDVWGSKP